MAAAYSANSFQMNSYRVQSVVSLSPGQLLLKAYDLGISALAAGEKDRASRVLAHLIDCLDFQYPEVAGGLFRLYRYCLDQIKAGEYQEPRRILRGLRDSWAEALGRAGYTAL